MNVRYIFLNKIFTSVATSSQGSGRLRFDDALMSADLGVGLPKAVNAPAPLSPGFGFLALTAAKATEPDGFSRFLSLEPVKHKVFQGVSQS